MTQPRIPPRAREDWDAPVFEALEALSPPSSTAPSPAPDPASEPARPQRPVSNILGIFVWHPELTKGWLAFNNHLFHSTLSDRVRELLTVRIGWLRKGEYEWAQHVRMAKGVGITDAEIAAISEGPDSPVWGPVDALLLRAADELCFDRYVSDATWAKLAEHYDRQQLMDIVFTVGAYDMLAMAFNTFGLELDPGLEGFPA